MMDAKIKSVILDVLSPYNPKEIAIFGSYARNENTSDSDIDILVSFSSPVSLFDLARIIHIFESQHGLKIDLVEKEGLSAEFLSQITGDLHYILEYVHRSA